VSLNSPRARVGPTLPVPTLRFGSIFIADFIAGEYTGGASVDDHKGRCVSLQDLSITTGFGMSAGSE
jgi:hypothetical protein